MSCCSHWQSSTSLLRPGTFLTCRALTRCTSNPAASSISNRGIPVHAGGLLIDNVLRPILVGKDTALPDYVVLIATVGGLSLFGLNGFVMGR